jgi:hypothetical protein
MKRRKLVIRAVEDDDFERADRVVALLATALGRFLEAESRTGVDFSSDLRMYASVPDDLPEATRW